MISLTKEQLANFIMGTNNALMDHLMKGNQMTEKYEPQVGDVVDIRAEILFIDQNKNYVSYAFSGTSQSCYLHQLSAFTLVERKPKLPEIGSKWESLTYTRQNILVVDGIHKDRAIVYWEHTPMDFFVLSADHINKNFKPV